MLVGEDGDNTRSLQRETSEISSQVNEIPKNIHILVVDTNLTTLLNMKKTMRQYAYQVTIEADAEKALAFLTRCKHEIDIVVWDFHMPGINGIQALKDICSKMDLPVVIMSDDNRTDSVMEATIHGACDYVMKPVREEIIANMWQHTVRKRMMSERKKMLSAKRKMRSEKKKMILSGKKKMMSKPELIPPVQSDLAQSDGLDKDKAVSKIVDQEQNIERKEETEAKRTRTTWIGESQLVQPDLVQTKDVDQHKNGAIIIYQDKGEEEKAAKIPRITTWTEETQMVQAEDLVQTNGVDQENDELTIEDKEKRTERKQRMIWGKDLHQKFLKAIEIVGGIRRASPKLIHECLEEMNVQGLTRSNVGSHLQKHRMTIEESQIPSDTEEIGLSTAAYRSTRRFKRSNNALLKNHSNNVQTASSSSSSYLTNGQAVNPIQQNKYQNGYLPMNNSELITNLLHQHQPQQQKYQSSSHLFNYVMGSEKPEQASGTYVDHLLHQPQPEQQKYQSASRLLNYVVGNEKPEQSSGTYVDHLRHQHQPQKQQYQSSSNQFNYVVGNEEPEQASGTYLDHLLKQHQPEQQHYQSSSHQFNYGMSNEKPEQAFGTYVGKSLQQPQQYPSSHQFNNYVVSNEESEKASGTYVDHLLHQPQPQPQQYQSVSHQFNNYAVSNEEPKQASGTYVDHLLHQPQPQQYQSVSHQFNNYAVSNEEPKQASDTYVDHLLHQPQPQPQQYQSASHQFNYVVSNEEPKQASGTYVDHLLQPQHQPQQYQSSHQFNYVMNNEEPEQASGIGVTGLELTYPTVPYDPLEVLLGGYNFNQ